MDKEVPTLSYGRSGAALRSRRKKQCAIAIALGLLIASPWLIKVIPAQVSHWSYLWSQRQFSKSVLSKEIVIYTDDEERVAPLRISSGYSSLEYWVKDIPAGAPIPLNGWPLPVAYVEHDPSEIMQRPSKLGRCFRGKLKEPSGEKVIVCARVFDLVRRDKVRLVSVDGDIISPAGWGAGSIATANYQIILNVVLFKTDRFTLFAGEADPSDPSSIRFNYELNQKPGEIVATIRDDGRFDARTVSGKAITFGARKVTTTAPSPSSPSN